jgi:hypothetical protein
VMDPWTPDTLTYSVLYKETVAVTGSVPCT